MAEKGILSRVFGVFSRKSYIEEIQQADYTGIGSVTTSGVHVNSDNAMRVSTVYACVRVISESIAQLSVSVVKSQNGDRVKDTDHSLYRLFALAPNSWQTPFEFVEWLVINVLLRGNAYAVKVKSSDGRVLELIPVHPDCVTVTQSENYELVYRVKLASGKYEVIRQEDMFHYRGPSQNGLVGLNPIQLHREAIGLAASTEKHGAALFGNGAKPGGIIKHPGKVSAEAQKRLKESWGAMRGSNAHATAILEEGMEWLQVGMTSEDSQFLETRKFQRSEIAAIFRVPLHKIGDLENATFSNIEHQSLEFVQDTLLPWIRRLEQAIQRDLMPQRHRLTHHIKFNVDSLLRGDIKTRYEAYARGIQWGFLSPNEAREMEDRNKREKGDEFLSPLNMMPASQLGEEQDKPAAAPGDPAVGSGGDPQDAVKSEYYENVVQLSKAVLTSDD